MNQQDREKIWEEAGIDLIKPIYGGADGAVCLWGFLKGAKLEYERAGWERYKFREMLSEARELSSGLIYPCECSDYPEKITKLLDEILELTKGEL